MTAQAAWWERLKEERQVELPAMTAIPAMTAKATWWEGLGEERQVALPPRT